MQVRGTRKKSSIFVLSTGRAKNLTQHTVNRSEAENHMVGFQPYRRKVIDYLPNRVVQMVF